MAETHTQGFKIEEANSIASRMASTNNELKSQLDAIYKEMSEMNIRYESEVGNSIIEKFSRLKTPFDQYYERVKGFVDFIQKDVTEAYSRSEDTIKIQVGSISDNISAQ